MRREMNEITTVKELIEILKQMPADLPVLVNGYESGFDNFYNPSIKTLKYVPEVKYWDGEFQQSDNESGNLIEAVVLQRVAREA